MNNTIFYNGNDFEVKNTNNKIISLFTDDELLLIDKRNKELENNTNYTFTNFSLKEIKG